MPVSYRMSGDVVIFESIGEYQWNDMLNTVDTALSSLEHGSEMHLLFDERKAKYVPKEEEIRLIVNHLEKWRHTIKKIALVVEESAQYGMGRMAQAYLEYSERAFNVFFDAEEAFEWLGKKEVTSSVQDNPSISGKRKGNT